MQLAQLKEAILEELQATGEEGAGFAESTGSDLPLIVGRIINGALTLVGIIFVVLLIYAGFLWMTAVIFGLSYGGAIIVEEAKSGRLSPEDLELLHLSIGTNHSMVEDPPLFLPMGIHPFWIYVPRLVMAIIIVRLLRLWQRCARRRCPSA